MVGCAANEAFISLTLVFIVIFTALQLMSDPDRGHNLLVSSVVAAYATYLTYVSVSNNPDEACNPTYKDGSDTLSVVLGLGVIFVSLCGTVYFSSKSVTGLLDGQIEAQKRSQITNNVLTSDIRDSEAPVPSTAEPSTNSDEGARNTAPARAFSLGEMVNDGGAKKKKKKKKAAAVSDPPGPRGSTISRSGRPRGGSPPFLSPLMEVYLARLGGNRGHNLFSWCENCYPPPNSPTNNTNPGDTKG
eukprot:FR740688.1.p1 GENE.FR740688.1~~FR740688.1.p1  ORF type:complete len:245 (+),score=43.65 FR740688.1:308-1042(+)